MLHSLASPKVWSRVEYSELSGYLHHGIKRAKHKLKYELINGGDYILLSGEVGESIVGTFVDILWLGEEAFIAYEIPQEVVDHPSCLFYGIKKYRKSESRRLFITDVDRFITRLYVYDVDSSHVALIQK